LAPSLLTGTPVVRRRDEEAGTTRGGGVDDDGDERRAGIQVEWLHAGDRAIGLPLILILVADRPEGASIDSSGLGFALAVDGGRVAYALMARVRELSRRECQDMAPCSDT
jgi:hypothetical protein